MSFGQQPPGGSYGPPPNAPGGPPGSFGGPPNGYMPPAGYGSPAPGVPPPMYSGSRTGGTDPLAIVSLVLGLVSIPLLFCCYIGWPLGFAAIITGIIALTRIDKPPQYFKGRGLAWGGIAAACLGFLIYIGIIVIYGAAVFASTL